MQDMSCLIREPTNSSPRLRSDVHLEKSINNTKENKLKTMPKTTRSHTKESNNLDKKKSLRKNEEIINHKEVDGERIDDAEFVSEDTKFVCKVCEKYFSSSASLEKHSLTHQTIEKSHQCKMCDMNFTTSSGLQRHMRVHKQTSSRCSDSDDSEESSTVFKQVNSNADLAKTIRKRRGEYTSNITNESSNDEDQNGKKKSKTINNNFIDNMKLKCVVCNREDFASINVLETHMENAHPDYQIKCTSCNLTFKNHRALNLHRFMVHYTEQKEANAKRIHDNSVSGFNDCTFIDFSSQKFPEIAKTVCEQSIHKSITEQQFRCSECSRDFPCESALEIHYKHCQSEENHESENHLEPKEHCVHNKGVQRDDFFANLDLQNKSPNSMAEQKRSDIEVMKPKIHDVLPLPRDGRHFIDNKDLADIQSILTVASTGSLLEQLTQKSREIKEHENEEVQDAFAAEFRKMKLRGEFPCRLCSAIFPNLRALKGHNRVHLSGNNSGPYRCNMCPQSSLDKAALVRHMRTHNGDRPYECAVCNYAFTTKANCERHLRNRHSKVTREDVKRSIIYHPSEDPNNDEVNSKLNISREDLKRNQLYVTPENHRNDEINSIKNERTTPVNHFNRETSLNFQDHGLNISLPRDLSIVIPQSRDMVKPHCSLEPISTPQITNEDIKPKIKVKGLSELTQIPDYTESDNDRNVYSDEEIDPVDDSYDEKNSNYSPEIPMDLSTAECQEDVLDLSKKKQDRTQEKLNNQESAEDYIPKTIEYNNNHAIAANVLEKTQQLLFARQQLLKGVPKIDPAANFYQLSQLYGRTGGAFPGIGIPSAFSLNPYFLPTNPFLQPSAHPNIIEMNENLQKELIRRLQLSGGGLVGIDHNNIMNNIALAAKERLQALQQQTINKMTNSEIKIHSPTAINKIDEDIKPQQLNINTETPNSISYTPALSSPLISSPKPFKKEAISSQSPNSVKMVIKNGVLMPKQKQRRYRTERPFSCEHCSARFTLRSNMERHIKQQHPQYWSQRQRSSIGNIPRKHPISLVPQNITVPHNIALNYDSLHYMKNVHSGNEMNITQESDKGTCSPNSSVVSLPNKTNISHQVKYAILAQQLKAQNTPSQTMEIKNRMEYIMNGENEDDDEEDALVIDEETIDDKSLITKQIKQMECEDETNTNARKVAQEILVSAKNQHDLSKDFEWRITGNLISKNPNNLSDIPTVVSQIGNEKNKDNSNNSIKKIKTEEGDLVSVSKLLDNAAAQDPFGKYFKNNFTGNSEKSQKNNTKENQCEGSEEDEEGLVASSGSTSEGNNSGSDENKSESENAVQAPQKKKSAYSLAPNRVSCPYCHRKFPWSSSLRRHVLTHTGQKPYKCPHCPLLFTTKSNCDRHLLRKHGSSSQQTLQNPVVINSEAVNGISLPEIANQGLIRNVPERPYKCVSCPSSTFSTISNLKKHMSFKHDINITDSTLNSPKTDDDQCRRESYDENRMSSEDENSPKHIELENDGHRNDTDNPKPISTYGQDIPTNIQNSDLPFKCHLCEGSYSERQAALDHIKEVHESEYELLVCKGALESGISFTEDLGSSNSGHRSEGGEDHISEENIEHLRGKFPDYANRKVVCAFCMRRFWSAEDLRRHMRTHTGERPFSCDVCNRRFTLKHSMLRHRKKHSTSDNRSGEDLSIVSGDEDAPSPSNQSTSINSINSNRTLSPLPNNYSIRGNTSTPISSKNSPHNLLSAYQISIHTKNILSPEIPSNVNNNNSPPAQIYEGKLKMHTKRDTRSTMLSRNRYSSEDNDVPENEMESGSDLIGNLLGISDKGMINKLLSSADEAAKLLGVNK